MVVRRADDGSARTEDDHQPHQDAAKEQQRTHDTYAVGLAGKLRPCSETRVQANLVIGLDPHEAVPSQVTQGEGGDGCCRVHRCRGEAGALDPAEVTRVEEADWGTYG